MLDILYSLPVAFFAGLVDAIAGGGGLIQIPGLLFLFPNIPVVTLLGTNKLASCCGTLMSSWHYVRTMKINLVSILPTLLGSFIFSALGAKTATLVSNQVLKPIVFIMLIFIGLYALFNKGLGNITKHEEITGIKLRIYTACIGITMGFYDGFFGPGTGSLLIFLFVGWLGFSFLQGSAFSKLTNLASNLAAMIYFASSHHILYQIALPMAVFNVLGNIIGAKLAIKRGSKFVRWVFLAVIIAILIQFTYQSHVIHHWLGL
jgi:uncharacterized membrane protein YfcA